MVAIWMGDHGAEKERDGKTILKKAKELEKTASRGPLGNVDCSLHQRIPVSFRCVRCLQKVPRGTGQKESRGQSELG